MYKFIVIISLLISSSLIFGQNQDYDKIIIDFQNQAQNNLSFQNGIFTTIYTPLNDSDALRKGFSSMQKDTEKSGGWTILSSKTITIDNIKYKAILYEYKNEKHIALHYKLEEDSYFFRIFNPNNYIKN